MSSVPPPRSNMLYLLSWCSLSLSLGRNIVFRCASVAFFLLPISAEQDEMCTSNYHQVHGRPKVASIIFIYICKYATFSDIRANVSEHCCRYTIFVC